MDLLMDGVSRLDADLVMLSGGDGAVALNGLYSFYPACLEL